MKTHKTLYAVEGAGRFPFDMLRYDASYPLHEAHTGASGMGGDYDAPRRVVVLVHEGYREWRPTVARWESFGWRVVELPERDRL